MTWSKDGEWLQQGDRVQVLDNAVSGVSELKISQARVEDSGVYTAEASSVHGTAQTVATVKVMKSIQETSEQHHKMSVTESVTTEIVEEICLPDTKEIVVREEKEQMETAETEGTHKMIYEVTTERVEIFTNSRPFHPQTLLTETDKLCEAQEVVVSVMAEKKVEDTLEEGTKETFVTEKKVQSPVTDVMLKSLEIISQETVETVNNDQVSDMKETSSAIKTNAIVHDVSEGKDEDRVTFEDEIREAAVLESLVAENVNKQKNMSAQCEEIPESQTVDQVAGNESDVNFVTKDSTFLEETAVLTEEEAVENSETVESTTVSTADTEVTSSAEIVAETSKPAGVKTVIIKETVTKKKKKSKDKKEKTGSHMTDVTQTVEEVEEKISEGVTTEDTFKIKVKQNGIKEDKPATESITVIEDLASNTMAEQFAEVEVEQIDVEYLEEELEGPLPVIEVKPLPTTIQEGEMLRLVCKVAKEPEMEITWSKDGKKIETAGTDARIHTVEDKVTGSYLLEIVETTTQDVGEYTLSAESEGGIVSCTVSVSVIAKDQSELLSSTVSEESSLSTTGLQRNEVDAKENLTIESMKPMQSVSCIHDMEETDQQKENIVVTDDLAVVTEPDFVEIMSADHEITVVREELIDSTETEESAVACTVETEIAMSAKAVAEMCEAKTFVSKETVTKKKKQSKDKQERTSSEAVDVSQSVEEVEEKVSNEKISEQITRKDALEITVEKSSLEEDKMVTESITVVEDAVIKNVAEDVAEAEVEEIDVEYSEEEFEGPLPVIEVKPLPTTTIHEGEVLTLVCKVADEPEVEITWSKDGKKLETACADERIHMLKDKVNGTYLLEIVETMSQDVGEYTLSAESEGGIVSCTVSVSVVAKDQSELPSSTVSEASSLLTNAAQATEPKVDTEGSIVLANKEPLQLVISVEDTEETNLQKENVVAVDMPAVVAEHEIAKIISTGYEVAVAREESVDVTQARESETVRTAEREILLSSEAAAETPEAKTLISKETVTKKKKRSKDKQEKTSSEMLVASQSVEDREEKVTEEKVSEGKGSEKVMGEDVSEIQVEESRLEEVKTVTESITDAVTKRVSEQVAAAEVKEIDVEYSEEEFEGPLPVIEVRPLPTTVNTGDTVRLVCKVADESAAEICWSKNGQKLEVAPDSKHVNMGVDMNTGMNFLEIAEASLEDIGEYTVTAENEGGIVACTVSVDVVSKLEVSLVLQETRLSSVIVPEDVAQFTSVEQVAVDSEVSQCTEPLDKMETGAVVIIEGSEQQRATGAAPVFVSVPQPICIDEGPSVRLQCQVEG